MELNTFVNLILFILIIFNINTSSNIIKINMFCWVLMLLYKSPLLWHIMHIFGIIQIMIGWYIFKKNELKLYRMLIILVWISFILNKKCLVNEVIKKNEGFIYQNFDDLYIIIGIPILFILSYILNLYRFNKQFLKNFQFNIYIIY